MVAEEGTPDPGQQERRLGAREGTAFGLMVAGAVMGMAWLGGLYGQVRLANEGTYALLFLGIGTAILAFSMRRKDE